MYMFQINYFLLHKIYITFGILALFTFALSVLVAASCFNIFEKAGRKKYESFIPIYNLAVLVQVVQAPMITFFLFFIPGVNIIYIYYIMYKLGKSFNVSTKFIIELILLPIIFIPVLAYSDYKYIYLEKKEPEKISHDNYLLMNQEEINKLNESTEESESQIDSIFKTKFEIEEEKPEPYKSKKIINKIEGIEIIDLEPKKKDEEKIEIIEL